MIVFAYTLLESLISTVSGGSVVEADGREILITGLLDSGQGIDVLTVVFLLNLPILIPLIDPPDCEQYLSPSTAFWCDCPMQRDSCMRVQSPPVAVRSWDKEDEEKGRTSPMQYFSNDPSLCIASGTRRRFA